MRISDWSSDVCSSDLMMAQLRFELVTPEKLLRSEDVHMVVVPGAEGDFGVLAGHAPFMSTIRPGAISVFKADGAPPERIFIDGGFAEVNEKGLNILAESATPVSDVDPEIGRASCRERVCQYV